MILRRLVPRWATALIVMLLAGCDNVEWGGAKVAVVQPPPATIAPSEEPTDVEERLPTGPVLYYVRAAGAQATIVPVAEILRDTIRPILAAADWDRYGQLFIAEHLRQGAEFALFRNGGRVGTFVLEAAGVPDRTICPRVPRATGILELVPGAEEIPEFIALAKSHAPPGVPRRVVAPLVPAPRTQSMAPILAERLLRARRAPLPNNWSAALAQQTLFPIADSEIPAFASTFLLGDSLAVGPGAGEGYSLFYIAQSVPQLGYDTVYADLVRYDREEKAAPRVVDYLDWNRDGQPDLLLEVYGTHGSWFEIMQASDGQWRRLLENPCPPARQPVQVEPDQETDTAGT